MNEQLAEELEQFCGTEEYHRWSVLFPWAVMTDGAKHLAEKAGAYWLMDAIASWQPKVKGEEFQVWNLVRVGQGATLKCDDGNGHIRVTQVIPFTDFPFDHYKLYAIWSGEQMVILLPGEY